MEFKKLYVLASENLPLRVRGDDVFTIASPIGTWETESFTDSNALKFLSCLVFPVTFDDLCARCCVEFGVSREEIAAAFQEFLRSGLIVESRRSAASIRASAKDSYIQVCPETKLVGPIACRLAGLPVELLERLCFSRASDESHQSNGSFEEELAHKRDMLWDLSDDTRFLDCLATMNPNLFHWLIHERRPRSRKRQWKVRRREGKVAKLMYRFAGRNDTTGLAGTTFWGSFSRESPNDIQFKAGTRRYSRRSVYPSPHWLDRFWEHLTRSVLVEESYPVLAAHLRQVGDEILDTRANNYVWLGDKTVRSVIEACDGKRRWWEIPAELPEIPAQPILEWLVENELVQLRMSYKPSEHPEQMLSVVADALAECETRNPRCADILKVVRSLEELRKQLTKAHGGEYARLMERADREFSDLLLMGHFDPLVAEKELMRALLSDTGARDNLVLVFSPRWSMQGCLLRDHLFGETERVQEVIGALLRRFEQTSPGRTVGRVLEELDADDSGLGESELVEKILEYYQQGVLRLPGQGESFTTGVLTRPGFFDRLLEIGLPKQYHDGIQELQRALSVSGVLLRSVESKAVDLSRRIGISLPSPAKDHHFFVERSSSDVEEFSIGGQLYRKLRELLGPLLYLAAYSTYLSELSVRRAARSVLARGRKMPFAAFMESLRSSIKDAQLTDSHGLRTKVVHDTSRNRVDIIEIAYETEFAAWMEDKRIVSLPDIMLSKSKDGTFELVLNELHSGLLNGIPGNSLFVPGQPDHRVSSLLTPDRGVEIFGDKAMLGASHFSEAGNWRNIDLEDTTRQLGGIHWITWQENEFSTSLGTGVRVGDLSVRRDEDDLFLSHNGERMRLIAQPVCFGDTRPAGIGPEDILAVVKHANVETVRCEDVEIAPEIWLGDMMVVRKTFTLHKGPRLARLLKSRDKELLAWANDLRCRFDVPRWVYAKLQGEKPVMCDLECLFSLEVLANLCRKNNDVVDLVAMQPDPESLWLTLEDGTYTAEVRFVACADGPAYSGKQFALAL